MLLFSFIQLKGIDHLDTAVIDEDLIGGALVEEADGDQHISSMTTFELAQVRAAVVQTAGQQPRSIEATSRMLLPTPSNQRGNLEHDFCVLHVPPFAAVPRA